MDGCMGGLCIWADWVFLCRRAFLSFFSLFSYFLVLFLLLLLCSFAIESGGTKDGGHLLSKSTFVMSLQPYFLSCLLLHLASRQEFIFTHNFPTIADFSIFFSFLFSVLKNVQMFLHFSFLFCHCFLFWSRLLTRLFIVPSFRSLFFQPLYYSTVYHYQLKPLLYYLEVPLPFL